jgi:hypothetical protein
MRLVWGFLVGLFIVAIVLYLVVAAVLYWKEVDRDR